MDKRIQKNKEIYNRRIYAAVHQKTAWRYYHKKLCETAGINKSTFYKHYSDIFDLSNSLEKETVSKIINSIPKNLEYSFDNPQLFTKEVSLSIVRHIDEVRLMFSGSELPNLDY